VPAWNAYALGFQLNTPNSEDSYAFGTKEENLSTNKGIVTQVFKKKKQTVSHISVI
jgi:hypothetical protein